MNNKWTSLLAVLVTAFFSQSLFATTDADITTQRINGVSEFLIERANENYFYIFEKKIKDNRKFQCYFPTTYSYVEDGDLRILMTTREVWDNAIKQDLDMLLSKVAAEQIANNLDFKKLALNITNRFLEPAQYLKLNIDGETYPINFIEDGTPQNVIDIINAIYDPANNLVKTLLDLDKKLESFTDLDKCSTQKLNSQQFVDLYNEYSVRLESSVEDLRSWIKLLGEQKSNIVLDEEKLIADCQKDSEQSICKILKAKEKINVDWRERVKQELDKPIGKISIAVAGAVVGYKKLEDYKKEIRAAESNTLKALEAIKVLKETHVEDKVGIDRLKKHVLFFAQISDAKTSDEVKSLLSQYTMPAVSFFVKREQGSHHILISSYLGYAAGKIDNPATANKDYQHGIIAPIGLEYSYGFRWGTSLSFMVAPFDFGYPVTLKLNGDTENLQLEDVVAPAAYLTLGIKDYPLNVGIGYQRGAKIQGVDEAEKRILLFIAFDMPLFTLY
ncbi:MAG: hypothetical protein PVG89_01895 [Gammaproteobacteria bacterium]